METTNLDKIISLLDSNNKITAFDFIVLFEKIAIHFIQSIIAGEYYNASVGQKLHDILKETKNFTSELLSSNIDKSDLTDADSKIEAYIKGYENIVKYTDIEDKNKREPVTIDKIVKRINGSFINIPAEIILKDEINFTNFLYLIELAKIDHDFNASPEIVILLEFIYENFKNATPDNTEEYIIKHKSAYLLYKIFNTNREAYKGEDIKIDNKNIKNKDKSLFKMIEYEKVINSSESPFYSFYKKTIKITKKEYTALKIQEIKMKEHKNKKTSYFYTHLLLKYYRKEGNPDGIKEIKNIYENKIIKDGLQLDDYDRLADDYLSSFFKIQHFRALIQKTKKEIKTNPSIENILKSFKVIDNEKNKKYKDFDDYIIISEYITFTLDIVNLLKEEIKKGIKYAESEIVFEILVLIQDGLWDDFVDYRIKHDFLSTINFMVLYMPYKECISDYNGHTVFLDSSYILPVNFKNHYNIFTHNRDMLKERITEVTSLHNLRNLEATNKNNGKILQKKLKELHSTNIQTLAIFTALIAFIISIGVKNTEILKLNLISGIILFTSTSFSFSAFVILLKLINSDNKWTLVGVYIIMLIIAIYTFWIFSRLP